MFPTRRAYHRIAGRLLGAVISIYCSLAVAVPAFADSHRARLSRDLSDRLAARDERATDVIVDGRPEVIDAVAARYGAKVKRRLQTGAVLEVTGGQLDALSQDPDVDHIAGDVSVRRMMAVTTVATGADQVWAGVAEMAGIVGRGIGIAIIDSGIA